LNGEAVAIVDRVRGEHAVNVIHSWYHSREIGDFLRFVVILLASTTREEERRVFKYLLFCQLH
jgi:hypothetical protein